MKSLAPDLSAAAPAQRGDARRIVQVDPGARNEDNDNLGAGCLRPMAGVATRVSTEFSDPVRERVP